MRITIEIDERLADYILTVLERDYSVQFYSLAKIAATGAKLDGKRSYSLRLARRAYERFAAALKAGQENS